MQVQCAERDFPPRVDPHQELVLQPQHSRGLMLLKATINSSSGILYSDVVADPRLQRGTSNPPGSEEHFGDAIQAPN